jgi:pimeloyl-ACP methyl ester carboxylesterase
MIYIAFFIFTFFILFFAFYQWQYFMVFSPTYIKERTLCDTCQLLEIETKDGVKLEGAVYEPSNAVQTLLVFVGRSHDAVALINKLSQTYPTCRVVTFNYRGYGRSEGSVNEKNLLQDGLMIAALVQKHYGDFYLLGFSLGSNIAAYVATKHKTEALFLVGAFDSMYDIAKERFAKLSFLLKFLRYKFPTSEYVQQVSAATYLFVSRDDETISLENARNLKKHIKNLVFYEELDGLLHKELLWDERVIKKINEVMING